jgi:protoporphyrinogen oxidase
MAVLEGAERDLPGLHFCANFRGGISVADCIKSGHAVAERIVAAPAGVKPAVR